MTDEDVIAEDLRRYFDALSSSPSSSPDAKNAGRHGSRAHRSRTAALVATAAVLLVGGAAIIAVRSQQPDETRVDTGERPSTGVSAPPNASMTLEPASDLVDGQTVTVTFSGLPAETSAGFFQCTTDEVDLNAMMEVCDGFEQSSELGATSAQVVVHRSTVINGVRVDCGERPGRCFLYAGLTTRRGGLNHANGSLSVVLSFRDDGPLPEPVLSIVNGGEPQPDADLIQVSGSGFTPGEEITLQVCIADLGPDQWHCDQLRAVNIVADATGTMSRSFIAYRLLVAPPGASGESCDAPPDGPDTDGRCSLVAAGSRSGRATAPMRFAPQHGELLEPTVQVIPPGPHAPGQSVDLVGEGFQIGRAAVATCTDHPDGYALCGIPGEGNISVGNDGSFAVDGFAITDAPECATQPGACYIGWSSSEGAASDFRTPLNIR